MQSTTKYLLEIRSSFFFQGVFFVRCYLGAWDLTKEFSYGLKTKNFSLSITVFQMPTGHHKYIEVGILGSDIYTFVRQYWSSEPAGDKKREYSSKVHNF